MSDEGKASLIMAALISAMVGSVLAASEWLRHKGKDSKKEKGR